jgi:hypothetical protein
MGAGKSRGQLVENCIVWIIFAYLARKFCLLAFVDCVKNSVVLFTGLCSGKQTSYKNRNTLSLILNSFSAGMSDKIMAKK